MLENTLKKKKRGGTSQKWTETRFTRTTAVGVTQRKQPNYACASHASPPVVKNTAAKTAGNRARWVVGGLSREDPRVLFDMLEKRDPAVCRSSVHFRT